MEEMAEHEVRAVVSLARHVLVRQEMRVERGCRLRRRGPQIQKSSLRRMTLSLLSPLPSFLEDHSMLSSKFRAAESYASSLLRITCTSSWTMTRRVVPAGAYTRTLFSPILAYV